MHLFPICLGDGYVVLKYLTADICL